MSAMAVEWGLQVGAADASSLVQNVLPKPQALIYHIHDYVTFKYQLYYFFFTLQTSFGLK